MTARGIDVLETPAPPGDTPYGDYLDELRQIFAASPDNGSAWHNLIHT
jgi:hypothetical protein